MRTTVKTKLKSFYGILCIILGCLFFWFVNMNFTVFAENRDFDEALLLDISEVNGISAPKIDFLSNTNKFNRNFDGPKLKDIKINKKGNYLILEGTLEYGNKQININSSGKIFKNEKTDNSGEYGNLILGDMSNTENINFAQLRVDKEEFFIGIILQMNDTKEIIRFKIQVDDKFFDNLYNSIENDITGYELEKKIISLYSLTNNVIEDENMESFSVESTSLIKSNLNNKNMQRATTYNGWKNIINALNKYGSVKLSSYSNIDRSFFKGGGWSYDDDFGNVPYSFAVYSRDDGYGKYVTQFALLDIVEEWKDINSTQIRISMQAKYFDGMIVKYDSYTDILSVAYYGFGISFNNFEVGINGLTDKAVFINRRISSTYENKGSIIRAAISLISPFETIYSTFEHLNPYETQKSEETVLFDKTYNSQYSRNNGKIVRGIVATSGNGYLNRSNHYINVIGEVQLYNRYDGTSWALGYRYECKHNM